jgi:hypothetical protein
MPKVKQRQCKHCWEWKPLECFCDDLLLAEDARHECHDCSDARLDWLDEQAAFVAANPDMF